jgi:hypothetical protein
MSYSPRFPNWADAVEKVEKSGHPWLAPCDGGRSVIGRQGPVEGVRNCGNRVTAHIEDIRCENPWLQLQGKRRVLLNVRFAPIATEFRSAAK